MASPFSGRAGRLAGMWAAGQATQGLGDVINTLRGGQQQAGDFLTGAYETGLGEMETGYDSMLQSLQQSYQNAPTELMRGRDAALQSSRAGYGDAERALYEGQDRGVGSLLAGQGQAAGNLIGARDTATGELRSARGAAAGELRGAGNLATGELRSARDAALGYGQEAMGQTRGNYAEALNRMQRGFGAAEDTLGQAAAGWDPLVAEGMKGYTMLGKGLGLGGAAGNAEARGAFQAGPGYQWNVEQATDAAQRAGNKIGAAYGGNTIDAVTRLGSNLANQEYGGWLNRLAPYQGAATAAVAGQTGARNALGQMQAQGGQAMAGLDTAEAAAINQILANQGNIQQTAGRDIGNVDMTTGRSIADVYGAAGRDIANVDMTTGRSLSDIDVATGKNISDLYSTTGKGASDLRARAGADAAGLYARTGSGLADMALSRGTNEAKLAGDYASQIAGLAGQYGGNMAQLAYGTSGNVASAQQQANNTVIGAGTQGMLAGQQAANNTWGAIMGGLGIGGNLLGASLKSGSTDSLLGQLFK